MNKHTFFSLVIFLAIAGWAAALVVLAIRLWPPDLTVGILLLALLMLPAIAALIAMFQHSARLVRRDISTDDLMQLSDDELHRHQLEILAQNEKQLELRELRLARRMRLSSIAREKAIDLLELDPSDEDLTRLVEKDRQLLTLIEEESLLAFNRILDNRYASGSEVDTSLVVTDLVQFVEKVATLYKPETEDILLETEIELIAKSLSSASLHMLIVIDSLPLNLKSYNTAKMYKLLRRSAKYYGTYKAFRPYIDHGFNSIHIARLALGANPLAAGSLWLASKLATHGAKTVGSRLLQRTALQLLNDFIRVIAFEAAAMYGGAFQHRDANWLYGTALVNLEISRGEDRAGRDAALRHISSLMLRNEFDRVQLFSHLSRHKKFDLALFKTDIVTTTVERENIARLLDKHCRKTNVNTSATDVVKWHDTLNKQFGVGVWDVQSAAAEESIGSKPASALTSIKDRLRKFIAKF